MSRKKPFSPEEFKLLYSQVPRLVVEVIVKTDVGVALTLRKDAAWNNLWHIPGGTVFYQEYVEDAIQRIAVEELSITVTKQQLLGYLEYPSEEKQRGFGWSVGLVFLCTPNSPFPTENQEGEKIKIFDYVPENTVEEHKKMLTQVLSI
ncbi:MAG: NUDIX hydrolase [Okeania sp. SIO2C9]|uniref:NUDIX hydrolase n=1 Tax=Okeania sp. SIO2C9 TaxID=2607791 RepID=UPI0013C022CF|nr:NUDIX hydrolase [Okeania sp. SIO2C9]NEQ71928.1 NUDIX hydrolase [Okeania sp. SIO2C9]